MEWINYNEPGSHPQSRVNENGFLIFSEIRYKPIPSFQLSGRYTAFQSDSYNSRLYTYESGVPGYFSIPVLYGQGSRHYLLLDYRIWKGCRGHNMKCPVCGDKAITLFEFVHQKQQDSLACASCRALLKPARALNVVYIVSMGVVFLSFFFSFLLLYDIAYSATSSSWYAVLNYFLPYLVIPVQVTVLFIPALVYTVTLGKPIKRRADA